MLISRTPFRLSFLGGGTDFPSWFMDEPGSVLSTTIDKYTYISCRHLPPFFQHKHRITYSQIENASSTDSIQHPAIRAAISDLSIKEGLEIHCDADLPARSGIGSSSSFSVGLYHALTALQQRRVSKKWLAQRAIRLERCLLNESGGWQDQIASSYGGLNHITFHSDNTFRVNPVIISSDRKKSLREHLILLFTGFTRSSSAHSKKTEDSFHRNKEKLRQINQYVSEACTLLHSSSPISKFGELLHESWNMKKALGDQISNPTIDEFYERALAHGAIGGKILGAGNGGFLLLFVPPSRRSQVLNAFPDLLHVDFRFENTGSQIIYYDG